MIYKFKIIILIICILSCEQESTLTVNWPEITLNDFKPRIMELEKNVSYIENESQVFKLKLSWKKFQNTSSINQINIYKQNNNSGKSTIILTEFDVNKTEISLSDSIKFDQQNSFFMTIINKSNEESPKNKSNIVSVTLTDAEEDDFILDIKNDSLSSIKLFYSSSGKGSSNSHVNVNEPKDNLLDSVSLNIKFSNFEDPNNFKKVVSIFSSYKKLFQESGTPSTDRSMLLNTNELSGKYLSQDFTVLSDYDNNFFNSNIQANFAKLFRTKGNYLISFYLYKINKNTGVLYVYKTKSKQYIRN